MIGKRYQQHRAEDYQQGLNNKDICAEDPLLSATQFLQSAPTKTVPPSLYLSGGTVYSHKPLREVNPFLGGPRIHYLLTSSSFHSQNGFSTLSSFMTVRCCRLN